MLSIVIFIIAILLTYGLNLIIHINSLSFLYITIAMLLSLIVEIAINAIVATTTCKLLPQKWYEKK